MNFEVVGMFLVISSMNIEKVRSMVILSVIFFLLLGGN